MSDKVLNVATVGTGIFATDVHLPTLEALPTKFKTIAAFNRTKAKAEAYAKKASIPSDHVYDSLDELLKNDQIDLLDALLPVQYNYETLKKAVNAGKPVIIEKPIAATIADARKIVALDRSTHVPILIAEQWAYFKSIDLIKQRLSKIGQVVSFTYRSTGPFYTKNKYLTTTWRQKPEHIGGYLSDGGVHQLALLTQILGQVESVSALTKQVREESGADDILFSTFKLDSGAIGTFTYGSAFGATEKYGGLIIYGTNGSITLNFSSGKPHTIKLVVGPNAEQIDEEETLEVKQGTAVDDEFENLYEAITKKDKSLLVAKPEVAFHHLAVVAAALESSSKNGDHVKVEKI